MWLSLLLACAADVSSKVPAPFESYTLTPETGPLRVLSEVHCEELVGDPRCAPRVVDGVAHVALWLPKPLRHEEELALRARFNFEDTELPATLVPHDFEHPRGAIFLVDRGLAKLVDDAMTEELVRDAAPRPRRGSHPSPLRFAPIDHMIDLHEEHWGDPYVWSSSASEAATRPGLGGERTILRNHKDVLGAQLRTVFIVEGFGGPAHLTCEDRAAQLVSSLGSLYSLSERWDSELHVIAVGSPFAELSVPDWDPWSKRFLLPSKPRSPRDLPSKPPPPPSTGQLCGASGNESVGDLEEMGVDRVGLSLLAQAGCGAYQEATTTIEMTEALQSALDITSRWVEVRIPLPESAGDNFVLELQVGDLWATVRARSEASGKM